MNFKKAVVFLTILFLTLMGAGGAASGELDVFQYRLVKKIKAAYKIKEKATREKAFMDLFYLEGADPKTKNVTVKVMYVRSMMRFKNAKTTFRPVSKKFKQEFVSKDKEYAFNLPVLGMVVIKGQLGTSISQFQTYYGKKGNELFFSVPVRR